MTQREQILSNKRVLITGGTGSLGKTLVRRILSGELGTPDKVIVMSRDEAKHHDMRVAYLQKRVTTDETIYRNFQNKLEFRIGDLRNYADVCASMREANVVINAAALKQVPNCEYFPEQAVLTNCMGPANVVRAIQEHQYPVETVIGISTDKACMPINVMGMTKAIHERIFTSANVTIPQTRFICARYGNVLASRGSVIPFFHEQIRQGGPVTLTVPEMTRFLMSLDEAVDCVFEALCYAKPGDTYVPRPPSTTVLNLAKALIGTRNVPIKVIGIRPAEKLHEILVSEPESLQTVARGDYYVVRSMLPELHQEVEEDSPRRLREFSSAETVISLPETIKLLEHHRLMVDSVKVGNGIELFEAAAA